MCVKQKNSRTKTDVETREEKKENEASHRRGGFDFRYFGNFERMA